MLFARLERSGSDFPGVSTDRLLHRAMRRHRMLRIFGNPLRFLACLFVLIASTFGAPQNAAAQDKKVLRVVMHSGLRITDPIITTAYIARNHGYMIYDTLFATDENFNIQPQMVKDYSVSEDKLTYTFTLRDGLKFHDGAPVTSADCIASIQRWGKR